MPVVDISIVTYAPDLAALGELVGSLREQMQGVQAQLLIQDNSPDLETTAQNRTPPCRGEVVRSRSTCNVPVAISASVAAIMRMRHGGARHSSLCSIKIVYSSPTCLRHCSRKRRSDDARVAAWELRQLPYEHPKAYDPATLDTSWVSGAATLFRRSAFDAVGGFEPRIFMYGEDVDLSWRLRASGFRLRYLPRHAVVHRTYKVGGEVKPLQILGGVETNLCLRARFGGTTAHAARFVAAGR